MASMVHETCQRIADLVAHLKENGPMSMNKACGMFGIAQKTLMNDFYANKFPYKIRKQHCYQNHKMKRVIYVD